MASRGSVKADASMRILASEAEDFAVTGGLGEETVSVTG